ncbi:alpha/beta hydrolase [Kutzneria sp. NPDC051319]|uniref:alpha/beta fold hydrolase n=1 Tax=Kutzneria sp. NPDC051319 TaxID=3155047 RepID=UPI00343FDD7B
MFGESLVPVAPDVTLFVARTSASTGTPLLVVHGGPDWDHTYLRDPLHRLRGVVLPDLRGCGRSTRGLPSSSYTWDAVVSDLLALLDALGIPEADVLGFSTGGLIAQRLVLAAPQRFRRLVVASSSVLPVPPGPPRAGVLSDANRAAVPPDLSGAEANRAAALAAASVDVWRPEARADYLARVAAIRFSGDWWHPWTAGTLPPVRVPSASSRLTALGLPLLLLHGLYDTTFPASLATQTAAANPAARAVILDSAAHMAHIDQPTAWLAALADFLA